MNRYALIAIYAAALAIGLGTSYHPTWQYGFTQIQSDPGDTVLNHYLLEHTWRYVSQSDYIGTLWSPAFFYPTKLVFAYSENLLGVAPIYWLMRLALPFDHAFQAWMIVVSSLNFLLAAWVFRRLPIANDGERLPHLLAVAGAFVWAFGLAYQAQTYHHQLIARFWFPFAIASAWRFALQPSERAWHRTILFAFLQCVTCINSGWFLMLGLAIFLPLSVWVNRTSDVVRSFFRTNRRRELGRIAIWLIVGSGFLWPYFVANRGQGREYRECVDHLLSWSSIATGPEGSRWEETLKPFLTPVGLECRLFLGFAFLFLVLAAIITAYRHRDTVAVRTPIRHIAALLLTALILLAIGFDLGGKESLWWWVRNLPGGRAIRAVGRTGLAAFAFAIPATLIGLAVWARARFPTERPRQIVYALALIALLFEQTGTTPESFESAAYYAQSDRIAAMLKGADVGFVKQCDGPNAMNADLLGMWGGMKANVPVVNGYSGRFPDRYYPWYSYNDDELRDWLGPTFRGRIAIVDPAREPWTVRILIVE